MPVDARAAKSETGKSRRGRSGKLSCASIAQVALELVDEFGIEALSMRTLAARCGVEAMSLYSHFDHKDELLSAVAASALKSMPLPAPTLAPKERLRRLCHAYRRLGHAHPNAFPLVLMHTRCFETALGPVESSMRALLELGLTPRSAVTAQRLLLGYVRGYTIWELGGYLSQWRNAPGSAMHAEVQTRLAAFDPKRFPAIRANAEVLTTAVPDEEFTAGLETLIECIAGMGTPKRATASSKTSASKAKRSSRTPRASRG